MLSHPSAADSVNLPHLQQGKIFYIRYRRVTDAPV